MKVWVSELTYARMQAAMCNELPVLFVDEQGFKCIEMEPHIVKNALDNFGREDLPKKQNIDQALNKVINHNQASGQWPRPNSGDAA